ncbi:MAG: SDR family NAD(P)-dependent oxidoreductase [Hydrogenophaga sp.]|uniref:SDR family NAD(P)-dependent oxidoreductase n=1 Tax=Hydrogenophaga sp. TaxID=1904254 RepID=UPI004036049E
MNHPTFSRAAIVTGAAGGIGSATVSRLLAADFSVLAVDRNEQELIRLWGQQDKVAPLVQDVTAVDAPSTIVNTALQRFGRLDALVNNAGVGAAKAVHDTDDEELDRFLHINFKSAFRLSREAIGALTMGGSIVNISSIFGLIGFPVSSSYAATKAALIGLTRQMAVDYGPRGIRVNAIAPGLISSPLTKERISRDPLYKNLLIRGTPFHRIGETTDIANAVNFLCSDQASFVNGHVLTVDGGWSTTRYLADA